MRLITAEVPRTTVLLDTQAQRKSSCQDYSPLSLQIKATATIILALSIFFFRAGLREKERGRRRRGENL